MAVREADAFGGEPIDVRGLDAAPVATEVRPAGVVQEDQEKIGRSLAVAVSSRIKNKGVAIIDFMGAG